MTAARKILTLLAVLLAGFWAGWLFGSRGPGRPVSRAVVQEAQASVDSAQKALENRRGRDSVAFRAFVPALRAESAPKITARAAVAAVRSREEVRRVDSTADLGDADTACTVTLSCAAERWRLAADSLNRQRWDSAEGARLLAGLQCSVVVQGVRVERDSLAALPPKTPWWTWPAVAGSAAIALLVLIAR